MIVPKLGNNIPIMGTRSASTKNGTRAIRAKAVSAFRQPLADALFTSTQRRLLGLLFGQPERSFFVTELIELADVGRGAVQRELSRLEYSGLIVTERHGNRKHCRANPDAPIYDELCSIILKTVGMEEQVRAALEPLEERMSLALIFGSVAKRSDTARSDIDLLVVSADLTLEELYSRLSWVEKRLERQVNPTLYTVDEFDRRLATGNAFLKRVLEGPMYLLSGELEAIKLSRLLSEVDAGLDALRQADFIELDQDEMLNADKEDRA